MQALVIDDSRALRRLLGDMLRELGFSVSEASNGAEGIRQLAAGARPDIVMVDWNMPEMNGLEFVQTVRCDASYDRLPIMMVTTETELDQMCLALQAGANEYVMKPFGKDVIADKLRILKLI